MAKGLRGSYKAKRDDEPAAKPVSTVSSASIDSNNHEVAEEKQNEENEEAAKQIEPAIESAVKDQEKKHNIEDLQKDLAEREKEYHFNFSIDPKQDGTCDLIITRVFDGEKHVQQFENKETANQYMIECQNKIREELEKFRQKIAEEKAKIEPITSGSTVAPAPIEESSPSVSEPTTRDSIVLEDSRGNFLHVIPELSEIVLKWLGNSEKVSSFRVTEDGFILVSTPSFQKARFHFLSGKPFFSRL